MLKCQISIVSGSVVHNNPLATPAQIDTIYDLQSTKPFFVDKINQIVLSRSIFDKVVGVFVNLNDFNVDYSKSRSDQEAGSLFQNVILINEQIRNRTKISLPVLFIGAGLNGGS